MTYQPRSIARMVKDEQQLIGEMVSQLKATLNQVPENAEFHNWKVAFLLQLRDFMNQLQKHFDLEEDSVFIEEIIRLAPHHKTTLDRFLKAHQDLIEQLESIIGDLKNAQAREALTARQIPNRLFSLMQQVLEHETEERRLLQEVYYQEFGAAD